MLLVPQHNERENTLSAVKNQFVETSVRELQWQVTAVALYCCKLVDNTEKYRIPTIKYRIYRKSVQYLSSRCPQAFLCSQVHSKWFSTSSYKQQLRQLKLLGAGTTAFIGKMLSIETELIVSDTCIPCGAFPSRSLAVISPNNKCVVS